MANGREIIRHCPNSGTCNCTGACFKHGNLIIYATEKAIQEIEYVELALAISRLIHDKCENVPHGIGMDVMELIKKSNCRDSCSE